MDTNNVSIINSQAALTVALHELLSRCDFETIGSVKDHFEKDKDADGNVIKTDTVNGQFLTAQVRMPKGTPIAIGGMQFYPTTFAIKIDAFHLEGDKPEGNVNAPKAASVSNAELLRQKLGKAGISAQGVTKVMAVPA